MIAGYMGKLLFIDLGDQTFEVQDLSEEMALQFIGGYGIGARVLYSKMKPGVDPLGPDSIIGFLAGPLTGTPALCAGRYTIVCKSPVNGGWNDSNCGGYFGPELKKAGFDGVFIKGAAKKPVYLWIKDGTVEIRDAPGLWGKPVKETEQIVRDEVKDQKACVSSIGPAGEKLSLMAAIMHDGHRAAARGGPGAVMGSKNLKAVAVRGTNKVPVADLQALKEVNKSFLDIYRTNARFAIIGKHGTSSSTTGNSLSGECPNKNWAGAAMVDWDEAAARKMEAPEIDSRFKTKRYSCANCAIRCGAYYLTKDGEFAVGETARPEYETYGAFGPMLLNTNVESIIKCNHICNEMGLDTISAGATVAWAMECYEKGILTKEETGGIELDWGNAGAIVEAIQVMADQSTEFGKLLALGSRGAARKLGKGFDCLVTYEGIEPGMHDPKRTPGYARIYPLTPTPGRHTPGGSRAKDIEECNKEDFFCAVYFEIMSCSGLCLLPDYLGKTNIAFPLLRAVVGRDFSEEELVQTGIRIFNMRQAFNLREGWKPTELDVPTTRCLGAPPLEKGPLAGVTVDAKELARHFSKKIGWDVTTWIPTRISLEKLGGMDDVVKDLYL